MRCKGLIRVCVMKRNDREKENMISINLRILVRFTINTMFMSNSSVSSKLSKTPDIINEEDYSVKENDCTDFNKRCIRIINAKGIYKTSWI